LESLYVVKIAESVDDAVVVLLTDLRVGAEVVDVAISRQSDADGRVMSVFTGVEQLH